MSPQPAAQPLDESDLLTIDELAVTTGLSVRTTRYYASLGLLPAPVRRGRMAYYGPAHVARLELVRAMQDHGFTLAAIERHLAGVPMDSPPQELVVQRALLTAWTPNQWELVSAEELHARAGRPLTAEDLEWLQVAGVLRPVEHGPQDAFQVLPAIEAAMQVRDGGIPLELLVQANAAVRRHMGQLADELTEVLQAHVLTHYATSSTSPTQELEQTMTSLRALTLGAIVSAFQHSAHHLAKRSLSPATGGAERDG